MDFSKYFLIFLDFDGVLNKNTTKTHYDWFLGLDPELIENLNDLIKRTDARIIVSSTWRNGRTVEELRGILVQFGFKYPEHVLDKTRNLNKERGWDIDEYLTREGSTPPKDYIILDDDADMLHLSDHLLQTDWDTALSKEKVDEVIRRFGIVETPAQVA